MTARFCDFCDCADCQTGEGDWKTLGIEHAPTADGRWICAICYAYDVCTRAQRAAGEPRDPCKAKECAHRPKLAGPWVREGAPR